MRVAPVQIAFTASYLIAKVIVNARWRVLRCLVARPAAEMGGGCYLQDPTRSGHSGDWHDGRVWQEADAGQTDSTVTRVLMTII